MIRCTFADTPPFPPPLRSFLFATLPIELRSFDAQTFIDTARFWKIGLFQLRHYKMNSKIGGYVNIRFEIFIVAA